MGKTPNPPISIPDPRDRYLRWGWLLAMALLGLLSLQVPFFWDNITLGSQTADHLYQRGLDGLILPDHLDAGHPPLFGAWLAICWALWGKSLLVSHLAMWPFLMGIAWAGWKLSELLLTDFRSRLLMLLFTLADATFLAQSIHVAIDLFALCFAMLAVVAMLGRRPLSLTIWLTLLCLSGLRGAALAGSLMLVGIALDCLEHKATFWRRPMRWSLILPWLPAFAILAFWLLWHHSQAGFLLSNPDSPWAANQRMVGASGMIRNLAIAGWRILDFGRLVVWIPIAWWLIKQWRQKDQQALHLALLFLIPLAILTLLFLPFANPIAHRYYLPVFVLAIPFFSLNLSRWIGRLGRLKANMMIGFLLLFQLAGNFWIYPDTVAQGWDGSLAHLPYFELRKAVLKENSGTLYSDFPMNKDWQHSNPGSKQEWDASPAKAENSWLNHERVIYSNVINDIDDASYDELHSNWIKEWEGKSLGVRVTVFRRP